MKEAIDKAGKEWTIAWTRYAHMSSIGHPKLGEAWRMAAKLKKVGLRVRPEGLDTIKEGQEPDPGPAPNPPCEQPRGENNSGNLQNQARSGTWQITLRGLEKGPN